MASLPPPISIVAYRTDYQDASPPIERRPALTRAKLRMGDLKNEIRALKDAMGLLEKMSDKVAEIARKSREDKDK